MKKCLYVFLEFFLLTSLFPFLFVMYKNWYNFNIQFPYLTSNLPNYILSSYRVKEELVIVLLSLYISL